MKHSGYTKHWRSIWQNPLFFKDGRCNTQYYAAWCWMIDEAQFKPNGIGRGQLKTSRRELARMFFDGNGNKARKFLEILATHKMTENAPQRGRKLTVITICNYEEYQQDAPTKHPQKTRKSPATPPILEEGKKEEGRIIGRATRLQDNWTLPEEWRLWAVENWQSDSDLIAQTADQFKDYWIAASGRNASKRDWFATWRNWCRNQRVRKPDKQQEFSDIIAKRVAREKAMGSAS